MPRPNKPRALVAEGHLARRVAYERERREYTYEGLAKRMTDVGCPINASALYKIEKGTPPRRITYAEAVALAQVFELPIADLATPPELLAKRQVVEALDDWTEAYRAQGLAADWMTRAGEKLYLLLQDASQEVQLAALDYLGEWAASTWPDKKYPQADPAEAAEYFLLTLRGIDRSTPEWRAHLDKYPNNVQKKG